MSEPIPISRKKIPWQDRDQLGVTKAFFLTIFEAFANPVKFFEKLEVKDDLQEPLSLIVMNSFSLIGPLIPFFLFWVPFLSAVFILAAVPVLIFATAFVMRNILIFLGEKEESSFYSCFYVLAFSTPAFILVYVPVCGYWLAALVYVVFVGLGLITIHPFGFGKTLLACVLVPLIVLVPAKTAEFGINWQAQHPPQRPEAQAEKILAAISIAAENYAAANQGQYPLDSSTLVSGKVQYLAKDYCGQTIDKYQINCDFRGFGYYIRARPVGLKKTWKKTVIVSTGGKLREELTD